MIHQESAASSAVAEHLSDADLEWLRQLESVFPTRPLVPMRTTEKLGKLGLIELRSRQLMITDKGRQYLRRAHGADAAFSLG